MSPDLLAADMRVVYVALRDACRADGRGPWQAHALALGAVRSRWAHEMNRALRGAIEALSIDGPPRWDGARVAHYFESGHAASRCGCAVRSWTPSRARACRRCVRLLALDLEHSGSMS